MNEIVIADLLAPRFVYRFVFADAAFNLGFFDEVDANEFADLVADDLFEFFFVGMEN